MPVLRYLLIGLLLSGVWLLVALGAIPGGLREVEEFSLYGWPAIGLLFLAPLALIWIGLWLVCLQRRVRRLQDLVFDYGAGPVPAPSYPLQRAQPDADPPLGDAWKEDPRPEPERPAVGLDEPRQAARAPRRVAYSALDPLPAEAEQRAPARSPQRHAYARAVDDWYSDGGARRPQAVPPADAAAQPRRARLPEPVGEADTSAEPLAAAAEPHRPQRAAPDAPRLEALTPTYRHRSEVPSKALSADQFAQYEARAERELNAIAMDLASIVSPPADYDRALDALNDGAGDAFFELLARDFHGAGHSAMGQQLAMVGGDALLETYLEKYEQLLVAAYRSDPGGRTVKRLVDSAMGRLHQAIESYRQRTPRG